MIDPETPLRTLHETFCKLTGRSLKYQFYQREWRDYAQHFTADDLENTLRWVLKENSRREKRFAIRTELLRIIGDLAVFDSLKAEAELEAKKLAAKKRQWQPDAGTIALSEMRHEDIVPPDQPPKRCDINLLVDGMRKAAKG